MYTKLHQEKCRINRVNINPNNYKPLTVPGQQKLCPKVESHWYPKSKYRIY